MVEWLFFGRNETMFLQIICQKLVEIGQKGLKIVQNIWICQNICLEFVRKSMYICSLYTVQSVHQIGAYTTVQT